MAENILCGTCKFVISPIAEIRVKSRRKKLQPARIVHFHAFNSLVLQHTPIMPNYSSLLDILSKNMQAYTQVSAINDVSSRFNPYIVYAVSEFHANETPVMQCQRMTEKVSSWWVERG